MDEAHGAAGDPGRPWAAIHDSARTPAHLRRYLTATPRTFASPRPQKVADGQEVGIATNADDPDGTYGGWPAEPDSRRGARFGARAARQACGPRQVVLGWWCSGPSRRSAMPRTIWSGAISFGLVTVPINVVGATENHSIQLHQYHLEELGSLGQHP